MKGSLYRGDISALSSSLLSVGATAEREPAGIFDDLRRSGAVIAAIVVVAAIAAGVITLVSGGGSGSLQAPAEAERPIKTSAPIAASDAPPPARATVTTPRGPRIGLDGAPVKTPLQTETVPAVAKTEAPRSPSMSAAGPRGGNATAMQAPMAAVTDAAASARSSVATDAAASVRGRNVSGTSVDTAAPATTAPDRVAPTVPVADAEPPTVAHRAGTNSGGVQVSEPARPTGASASAAMPEDVAPPPPAAKTASQSPSGLIAATTTTSVHLRAGPDNKAKIIATVPANASIMAPPSCKFWCTVEYRGQRGFIYKDFVKRPGSGTEHG